MLARFYSVVHLEEEWCGWMVLSDLVITPVLCLLPGTSSIREGIEIQKFQEASNFKASTSPGNDFAVFTS